MIAIGITAHRAWPVVLLGDVCDISIGRTPARNRLDYWGPGSPWLSIADMNQGRDLDVTAETITEIAVRECNCRLVPAGTVLLSFKLSIGKVGIARRPLFTNEAIAALPIKDASKLLPEFLYWTLRAIDLTVGLDRAAKGLTLNSDRLFGVRIPIPRLTEQRRIAAILDKADALRAKRRAALAQLNAYIQSIFRDTFVKTLDGPAIDLAKERLGVPQGWSWELLTDVARLATGHTPDRARDDYWGGNIPWISLTDIRKLDGTVAQHTLQNVTSLGIENSSSVKLPAGTVCVSRTASIGFVTVMGREMATSQDFVNWVCGPMILPAYLMWALLDARKRLRALSSGSTHKTIYMRVVEQFRVLVPPIKLQRDFSESVERVESTKVAFRDALAQLDSLFGSLQTRAFAGQL